MKSSDCESIEVPREQMELCLRRTEHLLSSRALAMARNNLHHLLAMAYSQGASDAAEVLLSNAAGSTSGS